MPVQAAITLNTLAYAPRGTDKGVSSWFYSGGVSLGGATSTLTGSIRQPNAEGNSVGRWVLSAPKLAAADSPCACTGAPLGDPAKVDIRLTLPSSFTEAERLDFYERLKSLVASPAFKASIEKLEPSWG